MQPLGCPKEIGKLNKNKNPLGFYFKSALLTKNICKGKSCRIGIFTTGWDSSESVAK